MKQVFARSGSLSAAVWLVLVTASGAPLLAQEADTDETVIDESFIETEPAPEIDAFLEDDLAVLAGEGVSYERGDRRDPFVSLRVRTEIDRPECGEGVPGLSIDNVEVTGIFLTNEGAVAQVRTADEKKSYLIREGDQLCDGDVQSISFDEVVFKQDWDEGLKPFRDVVKKLKPQGGVGS